MGCQINNRTEIPKINEKTKKMLSKLYRHKVIGFDKDLIVENKLSLIKISKLLNQFIDNDSINYLKDTIHIIFKLMNLVEKILKIRNIYGFRFLMINFDNIFFDKIKNEMIYNDLNIINNYPFKYILIDSNDQNKFSLNNFIFDNNISSYYYYNRIQDTYTLEKGINFYSFIFVELFKKLFKKSNNDLKYEKFRKTIIYNINEFDKKKKDLNFDNVKNIFVDALICNESIDEVVNSYVTDTCSSILSEL
jgi:hypothetical protein